jgi:hypothetical protein
MALVSRRPTPVVCAGHFKNYLGEPPSAPYLLLGTGGVKIRSSDALLRRLR